MGYFVTGPMRLVVYDGEELEYGPGDFAAMAPGHHAWALGDNPCVVIDCLSSWSENRIQLTVPGHSAPPLRPMWRPSRRSWRTPQVGSTRREAMYLSD
jgi:hypothetical protein